MDRLCTVPILLGGLNERLCVSPGMYPVLSCFICVSLVDAQVFVGGSDPIRTLENRVVKHHLITSLCVFVPTARSVL